MRQRSSILAVGGVAALVFLVACEQRAQSGQTNTPRSSPQNSAAHGGAPSNPSAEKPTAQGSGGAGQARMVEPIRLVLKNTALTLEGCNLSVASKLGRARVSLSLPEACHFALDRAGNPQQVKTSAGESVLVISSRAREPSVPGAEDCDTRVMGVFVKDDRVSLSEETQKVASCGVRQWDELMFVGLSSKVQPVPLQP